MTTLTHGLHPGVADTDYFAFEAASNSFNKLLIEHDGSAEEAKTINDEENDETPAKLFGRAFHAAMLEPKKFEDRYAAVPDDAPKKPTKAQINAKKPSSETLDILAWWDEFNLKNEGKTIISATDFDTLRHMRDKAHTHPDVEELFRHSHETELTAITEHEPGIFKKARFDLLVSRALLADFKTAASVTDEEVAKAIYSRGYYMQDPWYMDIAREHDIDVAGFLFVFCLKTPPYSIRVFELGEEERALGRRVNARAFRIYKNCVKFGAWPGYETGIKRAFLPPWAYSRLENMG